MEKWTIEQVKANGWLVLEVITGSRSYGLDTATSDTDIKTAGNMLTMQALPGI